MKFRIVYWYQPQWSAEAAARLVDEFETKGWHLVNPQTGTIGQLTRSGWVSVERDALIAAMGLDGGTDDGPRTEWWPGGVQGSVGYRVRRLWNGGVVHVFSLDVLHEHLDRVVQDLLDRILDHPAETTGFVVDRNGGSLDVEWDAVMTGADVLIDDVPDILGLTVELAELHPDLPYRHRTFAFQNLVIADWVDLYRQPPPAGTLWN